MTPLFSEWSDLTLGISQNRQFREKCDTGLALISPLVKKSPRKMGISPKSG